MKRVGIDIGGTQLRAGIFNEENELVKAYKTTNDHELTCEQNMDKLIDFILDEMASYPAEPMSGIGIGCPGPLSTRTGKILNPPNLVGWDGFQIVEYVEKRTKLKTVLNNDANVAGLAEALLGAGAGYESVVFIGMSTGIGGAYVYKGELVNGANSNAAEFWNMIVNEDEFHHKNANAGSLNEQSSGSGLEHSATAAFGRPMKPKELFDLYYAGDKTAKAVVERAADVLGKGIANITCTIDPDIFIIGGSVAIFNPAFVDLVLKAAKTYSLVPDFLRFAEAKFGDDAGLLGASLLV